MSVTRLLSKRDKNRDRSKIAGGLFSSSHAGTTNSAHAVDPTSAADFYGLFSDAAKPSSSEDTKIKKICTRIVTEKAVRLKEGQILWALRSIFSNGDIDAAHDLLIAFSHASEGIVIPYDPAVRMLGAVNRQAVTCFLDATLFAMFSRLDSFEAMLYNTFDDAPRNKLAFLLRVWVNLLRAGKLISTDITTQIQEALAEGGWADVAKLRQQDASEAFTFITEKLKLPLLTLKMDMYHAGKQDADDHKFINERLLELAIPAGEEGEQKEIKLEDCLEDYFNSRIEVRRFLERRSTYGSSKSFDAQSKSGAIHVESIELDGDASTPVTPISPLPAYLPTTRPLNRIRTPSIIQERFVPEKTAELADESTTQASSPRTSAGRLRKGSVRKEVLMPAWQFFSLIPWYTNNAPSSDAQVAAHFSSKRPVLGLCLKRYSMLPTGKAIRLNTMIDIPVEIGLPHFIQDDKTEDSGPLFGNFKLSLQSVVCHRGTSVDSGHYIALVRGSSIVKEDMETSHWMRFDDLAGQRISIINIHQALREETPYLLFYQIVPVEGDPGNLTAGEQPPSYEASQIGSPDISASRPLSAIGSEPPSGRPSLELPSPDEFRGRVPADQRRPSAISFGDQLPVRRKTDHDRSASAGRKNSPLSRSATLSKTFSGLSGGRSKERATDPQLGANDVLVEVTRASTDDGEADKDNGVEAKTHSASPSKVRKKERSKSRKGKARGKHHGDDPDRECLVM